MKRKKQMIGLLLLCAALALCACGAANTKYAEVSSAPIVPELIITTPDISALEQELASPAPSMTDAPETEEASEALPTPPPTPAETADPARYLRINTSALINITKHPGGETVRPGDTTIFTARADNITSYQWRFVAPEYDREIVWNAPEVGTQFPGLGVSGGATFKLELTNIPSELDGWYIVCLFTDKDGGMKASDGALIHVSASANASPYNDAGVATVTVEATASPTPDTEEETPPDETQTSVAAQQQEENKEENPEPKQE